jgi:hypothetical protein
VVSAGVDYRFPSSEFTPSLDQDVTLTGKLHLYCPALFNSLSLLEKEALNSSPVLNFLHPSVELPSGGGKGFLSLILCHSILPVSDSLSSGGLGVTVSKSFCVRSDLPVYVSQAY